MNNKKTLFLCVFFLCILMPLFSYASDIKTTIKDIDFSSYDRFKETTNGNAYNLDNDSGVQCVDGAATLWVYLGRWINTGGTGQAQGCWTVESARNSNAGSEFELITDLTQVKKGDIVVLKGNWSSSFLYRAQTGEMKPVASIDSAAGHVAFSDDDYNPSLRWNIYGQSTNRGFRSDTWAWDGCFLGAFRYKGWGNYLPTVNVKSGVYIVQADFPGNYALNVESGSTGNYANIELMPRDNSDIQKFRIIKFDTKYYCIKSISNGRWLDVKTPIGIRSNVQLYDKNTNEEESWYFEDAGDGYVYIKNKTGYYLDVKGDEGKDHANIQIFTYSGDATRKWKLIDVTDYGDVEEGIYKIQSVLNKNYYLDIAGDSTENNANIQLYHGTGSVVQQFKFFRNGNIYTIQSAYSDKWLDTKTPVEDRSNVKLYVNCSGAESKWALENAGNGYFYIRNNAGFYLDIEADNAADNSNVQVYHFVGNKVQKWKLIKTEYTVSYDANGGDGAPDPQYTTAETVKIPYTEPTRINYEFLGWSEDKYATTPDYYPGDDYDGAMNKTLYAVWSQLIGGTCGESLYWSLNSEGILTVSGCGTMPDFDSEELAPWHDFSDRILVADIEYGVENIGESAFYECEHLVTITMDDTVMSIGDCAFQRCISLENIVFSNALKEIGSYAFSECPEVMFVTLPDGLETIGTGAFTYTDLCEVIIPSGVDTTTWDFFYPSGEDDLFLYHITLPASVKEPGYGTFCYTSLPHDNPDFILPSGLIIVESEAFSETNPQFVWFSEDVETIGSSAFDGCEKLQYVYIPNSCGNIAPYAFPEGTKILGISGYSNPGEAEIYADTYGYQFINLENPFSGDG